MNKFLIFCALAVIAFPINVMAQDSANDDKKMALASDYTDIFPVENDINEAIESMVLQVPVTERAILRSILQRNLSIETLKAESQTALTDIFTLNELESLIAFYKTDEGRAVKEKMPQFQQKIQPILESMVRESVEEFKRQR